MFQIHKDAKVSNAQMIHFSHQNVCQSNCHLDIMLVLFLNKLVKRILALFNARDFTLWYSDFDSFGTTGF